MFDPDQARGMRMQGAGHIVFAVLPGGGDGGLLSMTRPGESDAWIEVDVCLIMSYALCGFANLGSLGILIGGVATMVPERRDEIVSLG